VARRLAPLIAAMAFVAAPAAAQADGTLTREGTVVVFRDNVPSTVNDVELLSPDGASPSGEHLIGDNNGSLTIAAADCSDVGAGFADCTNVTAFRIETGGGNDSVDGQGGGSDPAAVPLIVDAGAGNDWVFGGLAADTLDGGFGQDTINGNGGNDVVSYANRTESVRVDLGVVGDLNPHHGSANDGALGARDLIYPDVEGAVGGSGDDSLTAGASPAVLRGGPGGDGLVGSAGVDTLEGGDGADSLNPLGGADTVLAGAGVDSVETRDGEVDNVDCGADGDHALADSGDVLTSCEPPDPPAPPGPTIITTTVTLPSRVLFDLGYTFAATRRGTALGNLAIEVEPGARVTARCRAKHKRCKGTRDFARATAARQLRLRGFEGKRLPVGAKLTIQATKPGTIGVVKTLTIRRRKAPSVRTLCLPPGASAPSAC
jgi:hemolysin type calcium-binding protein